MSEYGIDRIERFDTQEFTSDETLDSFCKTLDSFDSFDEIRVGDKVVSLEDKYGDELVVTSIDVKGTALCYDCFGEAYYINIEDLEHV